MRKGHGRSVGFPNPKTAKKFDKADGKTAHTTLEKNCEIFRVSLLLAWTWFFLAKTSSTDALKHLFRSHFSALLSDPMALS